MDSYNTLKIINGIDIIGYIIANILALFFVEYFFQTDDLLIYLVILLTSIIVLKTDWILRLCQKKIEPKVTENPNEKIEKKVLKQTNWKKPSKKLIIKLVPISIKLLIINVVYYSFPVFLIWIGMCGVCYGAKIIEFTNNPSFFEALTAISVMLGIFQYYLKRHEEKIESKLKILPSMVEMVINDKTSFQRYYDSLDENHNSKTFKNWIDKNTNPKIMTRDLISDISKDQYACRLFFRAISKSRAGFQINIPSQNSSQKFEIIESTSLGNNRKDLKKSYDSFFKSKSLLDDIIKSIEKNVEITNYAILAQSNINIIHEILPEFISLRNMEEFNEAVSVVIKEEGYDEQKDPSCGTYRIKTSVEYRNELKKIVWIHLFKKILL